MSKPYSRIYESELLDIVRAHGITNADLVAAFFNYFSSDDTCEFLEDVCRTYDIDYEEELY